MMIQTPAINGDILVTTRRSGDSAFGLIANDAYSGDRTAVYLTADQAADLLESLVALGVRVNDRAQTALDRSA